MKQVIIKLVITKAFPFFWVALARNYRVCFITKKEPIVEGIAGGLKYEVFLFRIGSFLVWPDPIMYTYKIPVNTWSD